MTEIHLFVFRKSGGSLNTIDPYYSVSGLRIYVGCVKDGVYVLRKNHNLSLKVEVKVVETKVSAGLDLISADSQA